MHRRVYASAAAIVRSALVRFGALLLLLALALSGCSLGEDEGEQSPPQLGVQSDDDEAAQKLASRPA